MIRALLLSLIASSAVAQSITAPDTAPIGGEVTVTISGSKNQRDFATIVNKGARAGAYGEYQYVAKPTLQLKTPTAPGEYEIRLLGADSPYPTLASKPLKLTKVDASLDAPAQVAAGKAFQVTWTGPNNARDYVGIGDADAKKRAYITYEYTRRGSPLTLTAPDAPGEYTLRYFLGNGDAVIASKKVSVGAVTASVSAPLQVNAGAKFDVSWKGPNNPRDFVTMVKAGTPEGRTDRYEYTSKGSTLQLRAPDAPGDYEVRYATAQSYATLARAKVTVTANTASVIAPASAVAGSMIDVRWTGPNNAQDYITIVPKNSVEGVSGTYGYTAKGNPTKVLAPLETGEYEVRYASGQSHSTLAKSSVRITPARSEPGFVKISVTNAPASGRAVEIILDASGSMLQRIGSERRIDIAKRTLTKLSSDVLKPGTPFALRVFGREVDSCQTDLDIPLAPLDVNAVSAKIKALEAKNNAKTPIGASLDQVAKDLSAAKSDRLVIVLTDGEETCGGDPALSIEQLKRTHPATRVSIVGFAIDDAKLAAAFRHWADIGAGAYFDAKDAAGLSSALAQALQPAFEIVTAQGVVVSETVAGADAIKVPSGTYSVRIKGQTNGAQSMVVKPKELTAVTF